MGKVCCLRRRKLSPHIDISNTTYLLASSNLDQSRTQDLLWLLWHPRSQFLKLIFTWNWMTDMTSLYALYGKYYYWMYWSKRSFRFIECQGEILGSIIYLGNVAMIRTYSCQFGAKIQTFHVSGRWNRGFTGVSSQIL